MGNTDGTPCASTASCVDRALIVESRWAQRAALVEELHAVQFAKTTCEAPSIEAAAAYLSDDEFDACIVGCGVSQMKALRFISEATACSRSRSCCFVVLRRLGAMHLEMLLLAGADAVISSEEGKSSAAEIRRCVAAKVEQKKHTVEAPTGDKFRPFLIVDGSAVRQRQLRSILHSLGYNGQRIHGCSTLDAAGDLLARYKYRTLLLCLSPRKGESLEFLRRGELQDVGGATRVVAYSPAATHEDVLEATRAGAESFILYPFSAASVEAALGGQ